MCQCGGKNIAHLVAENSRDSGISMVAEGGGHGVKGSVRSSSKNSEEDGVDYHNAASNYGKKNPEYGKEDDVLTFGLRYGAAKNADYSPIQKAKGYSQKKDSDYAVAA